MISSKEYEQTIFITGTAGFIASHVADYLVNKYPNTLFIGYDKLSYCSSMKNMEESLKHENFKFIKGDINDFDLLDFIFTNNKIHVIMHFAAYTAVDMSFGNSIIYSKNNVVGTHTLLEIARKHNISKFIHVSTDEVYGTSLEAVDENGLYAPTNPYAATKAAAEMICHAYIESYKLPIIITRANNIFGTRQFPEKVIGKFTLQLLDGKPITLHGNGSITRNFLNIHGLCEAFDLILSKGQIHNVYNIGTDFEISIKDLANMIISILKPFNNSSIINIPDRFFNDKRYLLNFSKLRKLGWSYIQDKESFEKQLKDVVLWYKDNKDYWK